MRKKNNQSRGHSLHQIAGGCKEGYGIQMWKIDDITSRVTVCLILHNIFVLNRVMKDVNATYYQFFSLEENEEMMNPQSNECEHQHKF